MLFMYVCTLVLALASHPTLSHSPLGVTVRYEEELYRIEEEAGYVTLALMLNGDTAVNVTVSVNTLDLLNSSVGDAATGELLKYCLLLQCSLLLDMWSDIIDSYHQRDKECNFD